MQNYLASRYFVVSEGPKGQSKEQLVEEIGGIVLASEIIYEEPLKCGGK